MRIIMSDRKTGVVKWFNAMADYSVKDGVMVVD